MSSKRNIKFKCPYCDNKMTKEDLVIHINDKHEEMIPEGYTAFRLVFNYVNKKPMEYNGRCTECSGPTGWDENKGRYNRQCDKPSCKASYLRKFENNMLRTKGVTRISSTAEGQAKMLANRKISGTYKFQNGMEKTYTGSYELKALEFMDKVLNINPDDINCPGPILEYTYNDKKHLYITDFYYIPYNLIIEVKDGGKRPNKRDMPEYRGKQIAKEEYIIKNTDFNYLRLTDNDLSQLLAVFMDLKMQMVENNSDRVIHVNESEDILTESQIKNEPDIYYNKDKFDSGEINLCFITGHSGSGKSTMGRDMQKDNIEHYELDDLINNYAFSDENFKEYGDLIYSFFEGPGKKYRCKTYDDIQKYYDSGDDFYKSVNRSFINYAKKYAKSHKNTKFVIEGIWLYFYVNPEELKEYAVYIKGTSRLISAFRASKRDSAYEKNKIKRFLNTIKGTIKRSKNFNSDTAEKLINEYRKYFNNLNKKSTNEAMNALMTGYIPGVDSEGSVYVVNYMQNNVFSGEEERGYGISDNPKLTNLICRNKEGILTKAPSDLLEKCKYDVYMVNIDKDELSKKIYPYMEKFVSESFVYECIFRKKMYTYDQIMTEESAIPVIDYYKGLDLLGEMVHNFIMGKSNNDEYVVMNENSIMSLDYCPESKDMSCITYTSLINGKFRVESVEYPELALESSEPISENSIEAKFIKLLTSFRREQ